MKPPTHLTENCVIQISIAYNRPRDTIYYPMVFLMLLRWFYILHSGEKYVPDDNDRAE